MDILKFRRKPDDTPEQPNTRRRSFMWKLGAAVPAVLAAAVSGNSRAENNRDAELKDRIDRLSNRLGALEDENAVRRLHRTYENLLNDGRFEEVLDLFTDDAEVMFNGGIFKGKAGGLRRLYVARFKSGSTGKRIEPAPGFHPDAGRQQDSIAVAADRKSADAQFPYSIQVGTPIISDSQLVQMARLQGEGIVKWWEGGTYEISYVRAPADGSWKIKGLEYRVQSKANYRPGRSHADPISVPPFAKAYPEDPAGPDRVEA